MKNNIHMDEFIEKRIIGTVLQNIPLPVIPLYDLALAAQLVPCNLNTLKWRLAHHKEIFKPVYRRVTTGRRIRLMSALEIIKMRSLMLKGPGLADVLVPYQGVTPGLPVMNTEK